MERLTDAGECPGAVYHYGYDAAGNRTGETVDGALAQQASYDAVDQVLQTATGRARRP